VDKQKLLNSAIEMLSEVDTKDLETVQINVTDYDDGSKGVSVELTFPSEKET